MLAPVDLPLVAPESGSIADILCSKCQYETTFKKWNLRKNLSKKEWEFVHVRTKKRKACDKDSAVYLNDFLIPAKRVQKEFDRSFTNPRLGYSYEAGELFSTNWVSGNALMPSGSSESTNTTGCTCSDSWNSWDTGDTGESIVSQCSDACHPLEQPALVPVSRDA
jgi:hypothetical protein